MQNLFSVQYNVFIHRSIKTRIETDECISCAANDFLVFIHRSIKTRIETGSMGKDGKYFQQFLYIDPLKQGLKPGSAVDPCYIPPCFYT